MGRPCRIGPGLLVLLGVTHDDDEAVADRLADKVRALRIFEDADGRMNEPLGDREASSSASSRSTATRAAATGRRTSRAARPEQAEPLYERFRARLGARGGAFGAAHGRRARQRRAGDAAAGRAVTGWWLGHGYG